MIKNSKTDKICVEKIIEHILVIKDTFKDFNINSPKALEESKYAKFINAQLITNIFELEKNLQDETLDKIGLLKNIKLKVTRNIASHDYDSLDFDIFYRRCKQLIADDVVKQLREVINDDN